MSTRPRFSVVLPVYNRAGELPSAVRSVLEQTTSDWELVVVDDASSDDVAGVVADIRDPRVRLVVRDVNGGVAAAENSGLAECAGDYVAFLHSDDRFAPTKLAHQGAVLDAAPPDVVAVESAFVAASGPASPPALSGVGHDDFLTLRSSVHVVPMLFRREAVAAGAGFDAGLRAWEDWDLVARLLARGRVLCTDEVVAELRREGGDRLVESPWMVNGLEYLLDKYGAELAGRPAVRALWHRQLARRHLHAGSLPAARRHLARCVRDDPRQARLLVPLVASLFGLKAARRGWAMTERLDRRRDAPNPAPAVSARVPSSGS